MLLLLPDHFYRIPTAFSIKKPIFLYFLKPIIDFLSVVMLYSLDDALGFQPPPPTHRKICLEKKAIFELFWSLLL